jgi:hypothetical protein
VYERFQFDRETKPTTTRQNATPRHHRSQVAKWSSHSHAPPRRRSLLVTNQIGVEGVRAAQYDDEAELNESSNEKNAGRRRIGHVDIKYVGSSRGGPTHFGGATAEDPQIRRHHRR